MRADKFLKVSRLLKRRSAGKEAADAGKILVNGKTAKPSHILKEGDLLTVDFAVKPLTVRILLLTEHASKETSGKMYEVVGQ